MITCATSTDTTFNAPDLLDAYEPTKQDKQDARNMAVDYVISTEGCIEDVLSGEFGDNARLIRIMANLTVAHGSHLTYWIEAYRTELAEKLAKQIDARYEVELEALYD